MLRLASEVCNDNNKNYMPDDVHDLNKNDVAMPLDVEEKHVPSVESKGVQANLAIAVKETVQNNKKSKKTENYDPNDRWTAVITDPLYIQWQKYVSLQQKAVKAKKSKMYK